MNFSYRKTVSYAASYNRRPLIDELTVATADGSVVADATVTVELTANGSPLVEPWTRTLGAIRPVAVVWTPTDFAKVRIDDAVTRSFDDQVWATYVVTVTQADEVLARETFDVSILAANSWLQTPPFSQSATELAALVQPNHPGLTPILKRAANLLASKGFIPELSGYQSVPESGMAHVDAMVECLYEAVRELGIGYIDPPPSWDATGLDDGYVQRVRTSGQVLDDKLATCLDTAALMAALIENVGLRPVMALVPQHAFAGYWRNEDAYPSESTISITAAMNAIQSDDIRLFETTSLCGGEHSHPYSAARLEGATKIDTTGALSPENATRSVLVDIVRARRVDDIRPIPAVVKHDDGTVELVEYRPQDMSISLLNKALKEQGGSTAAGLMTTNAPDRVRRWMDALLDLSLRNPLINYRFPRGSSTSLMIPEGALGTIEDLLQTGQPIRLSPAPSTADGSTAQLTSRHTLPGANADQAMRVLVNDRAVFTTEPQDTFLTRMRRIATNARSLIAENGTNSLHLAIGMVVWTPEGKAEVSSPLILVPVRLRTSNRSRTFHLEIDAASSVTPNFSLAEKLRRDAGLDLPKLVAPDLDAAGIDVDALIAYMRQAFTDAHLTDFRIDESCTLGFFDFSTYRLWRDLQDNWPTLTAKPLVNHLVHTPFDAFEDPAATDDADVELDDFAASLPVASDGSQALAVHRALNGKTFVLQGPPGTGKSQTITNLLAQALQSGKRVLFIAEKPTALGVVRDRLAKVGLASYGLNLHSRGMRPAEVRAQLLESLDATASPDKPGFEAANTELDRAIPVLQRYPERLHRKGKFGESAYSARSKLLAMADGVALDVPLRFLNAAEPPDVDSILHNLRDIADAGPSAGTISTNTWSLAMLSEKQITPELQASLAEQLGHIEQQLQWLESQPASSKLLETIETWDEFTSLAPLADASLVPLTEADAAADTAATSARTYVLDNLNAFEADRWGTDITTQSLATPVDDLRAALQRATGSFFIGRKKKVTAVAQRLQPYLKPDVVVLPNSIAPTLDRIQALQNAEREFTNYARIVLGTNITPGWNPVDETMRTALRVSLMRISMTVGLSKYDGTPARTRLRTLLSQGSETEVKHVGILAKLLVRLADTLAATPESVKAWHSDGTPLAALQRSLPAWDEDAKDRDLLSLRRWTHLLDLLAELRKFELASASQQILDGTVPHLEAERSFERGFYGAVLRQQLDLENLNAFDGVRHGATIRAYSNSVEQLRNLSPGILASDMLGIRGFNSGVNVGAVGELRRELSKTRNGKKIRTLLKDHWHVISKLTPCVLAVPDAVVRYLDSDLDAFDLVVFDEASQIKVPHAIGALGRANAAVVVGDSKQMPPTSVAQSSSVLDDEDRDGEEESAVDEESILTECSQARVPDMMLNWHYRSEDESLIAFSNAKYYDGRLHSLPSPTSSLERKGVSFTHIPGQFHRRGSGLPASQIGTNPLEASAIVEEVTRRVNHPELRDFSIGVVTFNKPQQSLIQDLLSASEDDAVQAAIRPAEEDGDDREHIEVWNLETVQGQERDIILFSVAFSKNATGRVPLNFGPLNNSGGERRLNVAVTRARRQVVVYCSFQPEELKVEGSSSQGLHDLHAYLTLARHGVETSGSISSREFHAPDRHRDEVLAALRLRGISADPDIGLSDFKVDIGITNEAGDGWMMGILLDGDTWHDRPTVGDRDSLPPLLLENRMGWPAVERIWLPDWLRDADSEVSRIIESLSEVKVGTRAPVLVGTTPVSSAAMDPTYRTGAGPAAMTDSLSAPPSTSTAASSTQESPADPFWSVPVWDSWPVQYVGDAADLDYLDDRNVLRNVQRLAIRIQEHEGPIHPERLAKLVAQSYELQRVASRRVEEIRSVCDPLFECGPDGFLFEPNSDPLLFTGWYRTEPGKYREPEEVSLVELGNVMRDVARVGFGAVEEELLKSTTTAIGVSRLTTGIRDRLKAALTLAYERGILEVRNGYVVTVEVNL